jgi:DeoR/GlpR family transcriptional regulator of sugar metabolism
MVALSKQLIVVCDSSKLEKVCLLHVADFQQVHTIVTDVKASPEIVEEIRKLGTNVILAG